MLDGAVAQAGLSANLDDVLSAAEVGCFKPDRRVYQLACDRTGAAPSTIAVLSSNRWDVAGAKAFGFQTNWINRSGAPHEYPNQPADRTVATLRSLLDGAGAAF